jgi:hypothetical protein
VPKRGKIFRILRECEASARSNLKSRNNPPEDRFAALKAKKIWDNNVGRYHKVIRRVGEVRRNIAKQNSPAAALAAFRLGQLVIASRDYEALVRLQKDLERKSEGGKNRALSQERIQNIVDYYHDLHHRHPAWRNRPYILAQMVAREILCDPKTVLKYVKKDRKR